MSSPAITPRSMSVSVIVPSWRRPADLGRCLAGLAAQDRAPDEVIVVARAEDEETLALLGREQPGAPAVRALRVSEPGVVASLNAGMAAAKGDLFAITDDDAVPRPDWLERIADAFGADAGIGGVGGRDWVRREGRTEGGSEPVVGRVLWYGRVVGNHHLGVGEARDVDLLKGVNLAFRREALRGVEIAEDLRGAGAQVHWEIGLCLAIKRAGWRLIYDPAIAVDHFPAQRFDEDRRTGRPLIALEDEVYNETYALLRHLPRWRGASVLGYGTAVGTRLAPGMVTAVERRLRGERVGPRLRAAERARLEAFRAVLRQAGRRHRGHAGRS